MDEAGTKVATKMLIRLMPHSLGMGCLMIGCLTQLIKNIQVALEKAKTVLPN